MQAIKNASSSAPLPGATSSACGAASPRARRTRVRSSCFDVRTESNATCLREEGDKKRKKNLQHASMFQALDMTFPSKLPGYGATLLFRLAPISRNTVLFKAPTGYPGARGESAWIPHFKSLRASEGARGHSICTSVRPPTDIMRVFCRRYPFDSVSECDWAFQLLFVALEAL